MASGMRCAETTRASKGTRSWRSTATACCMTSQSLLLPITTPTRGSAAEEAGGVMRPILPVRLADAAGEPLERLAIARGNGRDHVRRQRRRRRPLVPTRNRLEVVPHELLVVARRRDADTVVARRPEARRIRRQHLVHEDERAVGV